MWRNTGGVGKVCFPKITNRGPRAVSPGSIGSWLVLHQTSHYRLPRVLEVSRAEEKAVVLS